jgi:hypothetical protein
VGSWQLPADQPQKRPLSSSQETRCTVNSRNDPFRLQETPQSMFRGGSSAEEDNAKERRSWRGARPQPKVGRALLPVWRVTGRSARPTEFAHDAQDSTVCSAERILCTGNVQNARKLRKFGIILPKNRFA